METKNPINTTVNLRMLNSISENRSNCRWLKSLRFSPTWVTTGSPTTIRITASSSTAFRAPTFEEKYDQTSLAYADFSPGIFKGNKLLEPEYIQTAETGVDYLFTLSGFKHRVASNAF